MQQTFIPLCQALHIRSDPYWYWDACFDSEKDWDVILEKEHEKWWNEVEKRKREYDLQAMSIKDDNDRAFATWEAQARGRMEGMIVCNLS